jgi:hypothetical protein
MKFDFGEASRASPYINVRLGGKWLQMRRRGLYRGILWTHVPRILIVGAESILASSLASQVT